MTNLQWHFNCAEYDAVYSHPSGSYDNAFSFTGKDRYPALLPGLAVIQKHYPPVPLRSPVDRKCPRMHSGKKIGHLTVPSWIMSLSGALGAPKGYDIARALNPFAKVNPASRAHGYYPAVQDRYPYEGGEPTVSVLLWIS